MNKKLVNPPKLANKLLRWFLKEDLLEEVLGDLEEQFETKVQKKSKLKSKLNYWWQVINYLRPFAIKSIFKNSISMNNFIDLMRHNLKLFVRTTKKHKSTFFINLTSLTLGLASSIFIYLWVTDEYSYNNFHDKQGQLYQAMYHHEESGSLNTNSATQAILGDALIDEVPEIEMAVTDTDPDWFGSNFSITNGTHFYKSTGKFSSKDYFNLFSFSFLNGSPEKSLSDVNNIVISKDLALRLFNTTDVIGKTVTWHLLDFGQPATISGVFDNIPQNSTEQFDFVIPFENFAKIIGESSIHWGNYNAYTYVRIKDKTDINQLNVNVASFAKDHRKGLNVILFFRAFSDKYLFDQYTNGIQDGGRITYVHLFSIIAIFIILIGCINFMNLSTARSSWRMKETGLKKSLGATRNTLIAQYLTESILTVFIAMITAHFLVIYLMPQFNSITDKTLSLSIDSTYLFSIIGISVIIGLIAGSYPAWYLSSFKPILALKGLYNKQLKGLDQLMTRKGLVIFQFSISIILIISVIIIYQQIEFVQSKNLGYNRENLLILPKEGKANSNMNLFLSNLESVNGVQSVSASAHNLTGEGNYTTDVNWIGKDPNTEIRFANASIYYQLIETLGLEVIHGRTFDRSFSEESNKLILNETAIKTMGLSEPIGKTIQLWGEKREIIGVVKDFHFNSLHNKVQPLFFKLETDFLPHFIIRIENGKEKEALAGLEEFYDKFNPGYVLRYQFMDLSYQSLYDSEKKVAVLSKYFAGFAIFISCMGLFGLAAFTAEKRIKEIGIRKILGASEISIIILLTSDFTKTVIIAVLISLPISYFIAQYWLQNFAYTISLHWWYFIPTGILSLLIAWLTVSIQTFFAAKSNPTECVKNE